MSINGNKYFRITKCKLVNDRCREGQRFGHFALYEGNYVDKSIFKKTYLSFKQLHPTFEHQWDLIVLATKL